MKKNWSYLAHTLLLVLFVTALVNMICVKALNIGLIYVEEPTSEMLYNISVSYLVAYFVFFITVVPTALSNRKRKIVIGNKLTAARNYISTRLEKIKGFESQLSESNRIDLFSDKRYDHTINIKGKKASLHEIFNQINKRIERLSEIQSLVIATNDAHLYTQFDKVINCRFRRTDNLYLTTKLDNFNDIQMKIDVGTSLWDLHFAFLPDAIKASQVPFTVIREKSKYVQLPIST
jgi:hypothetical protein